MKKEKPQKISPTLEDLLKSLYSCLQSLVRVIEKENKVLSQEHSGVFGKILDQKEELLKTLHELEEKINSYKKGEKSDASRQLGVKLSKIYTQLQEVINANHILLRSNLAVSGKIIEIYKAKQLEHTVGQLGYNKDGEMVALKKLEKVMPSISLNNKV